MSKVTVTRERTVETRAGPTTTTKYTTDSDTSFGSNYTTKIAPRQIMIQRTAKAMPGSTTRMERSVSYGMNSSIPAGAYANVTATGVSNVKTSREQEKNDMQDLNQRFASYIEKVRFLEAQNRKLADELANLRAKWGKETTAIKKMYEVELAEARRQLDDAEKEKARLEIQVHSLDELINELRSKIDELQNQVLADRETIEHQNQQLSDYEAEINLLRRRVNTLEEDRARDKKEIARLTEALNRARADLDAETLEHIDAENKRQTLEEELEFLKGVHEQELKELSALAYRDTTKENREYWKSELSQAIREIQETYDEKMDALRGEMEGYYNMKIQEFRTGSTRAGMETSHAKEESKRLRQQLTDLRSKLADCEARNGQLEREMAMLRQEYEDKEHEWESENNELKSEVAKLRAEMEAILHELQNLMDTKLGLELEIAAYRKLLEGEENRVGLKSVVETMLSKSGSETESGALGDDSSLRVSQVVKGEMSAKTTYQRSAKGPVSINECSADGKYITLENTGKKDEHLGSWMIKRDVDNGKKKIQYKLADDLSLAPRKTLKVFSKHERGKDSENWCSSTEESWGVGANITTRLFSPDGNEKATHIQKTIYSS